MKKLLLIALVLTSSAAMANYTTCNDLGDIQICRDSSGFSSTTHRIGDTYITNGSGGYSSTTHKIGDDMYMGHDNRGNSWNIYDNNSYRNY
ncbi:TPA: hypothetical protein ACPP4D_000270 [Haemophilus influenzae]|jgi:hypothetical protein